MASSRRRRIALPRRLGGVLAGTALSCIAIATSLVATWLGRGEKADDNGSGVLLIAAAAAVPAFLLGATALVLLSERTSNAKITGTLTALAVFISLIPLEMILLQETWAVFVFSALFAVLVALVLSEAAPPSLPTVASPGLPIEGRQREGDSAPAQPPFPLPVNNVEGEKPQSPHLEVANVRHRHFRRSAQPLARQAGQGRDAERARVRRPRRRLLRRQSVEEPQIPQAEPTVLPLEPVAQSLADALGKSNDLMAHLVALSQELEPPIERLERVSTSTEGERDKRSGASAQEEMDPVGATQERDTSEAVAALTSRLDALGEQLASCVDRLERLAADIDGRLKAQQPATSREETEPPRPRKSVRSPPPASSEDELLLISQQVSALMGRLDRGIPDGDSINSEFQVIRMLREQLAKFLRESGLENGG